VEEDSSVQEDHSTKMDVRYGPHEIWHAQSSAPVSSQKDFDRPSEGIFLSAHLCS
jgi:hypothetical protein